MAMETIGGLPPLLFGVNDAEFTDADGDSPAVPEAASGIEAAAAGATEPMLA